MRSYVIVLFSKYNKSDKVMEDSIGRACSTNGEKRIAFRVLVGKPKRPLRRPRRKWVDNIKIDLIKIGLGGMD
jgi:hypothetical protein